MLTQECAHIIPQRNIHSPQPASAIRSSHVAPPSNFRRTDGSWPGASNLAPTRPITRPAG